VAVPDEAGSPVDVAMPEARTASILNPEAGRALFAEFNGKLREVVTPLIKELWRADITRYAGTQIIRYGVGGHYGTHADAGRTMTERFFTVLCYLNDDFEGGQTWFPSLGYTTAPRRGKAILFPARYMHRAVPVASGEKYVLASWGVGPAPIDWI
jgi:Rps23 Pro-64 3,4-dihydroxylase Tpa1-like proline 4-hydroxylase